MKQPRVIPQDVYQYLYRILNDENLLIGDENFVNKAIEEAYLRLCIYVNMRVMHYLPKDKTIQLQDMIIAGRDQAEVDSFVRSILQDTETLYSQFLNEFQEIYLGRCTLQEVVKN